MVRRYLPGRRLAAPVLPYAPIHLSAWKVNSKKFRLLLTVAVIFANGPLILLLRHDVRVPEGRRALHCLLVHI